MRAADLKAVGPMMVLLNEALLPNLVQTTEGAPAIVHCGPFANIAHGTSSVLAQRMGLHLADYVVNETGFAADLGAEKFFDLVMPMCGHVPSAAVVIVTLKALRAQGGSTDGSGPVERGFPNLQRHLENLKRWGVPSVVALNRFPGDADEDLERVRAYCLSLGVEAALSEGYAKGGDGMTDLADRVVAAAATHRPPKGEAALRARYPARGQDHRRSRRRCMAPTRCRSSRLRARGCSSSRSSATASSRCALPRRSISFSDDPKVMGAPTGWTLTLPT